MLRYVVRRLLYAVPILIGVSLATFLLFYAVSTPRQIARRNISAKNPTNEQIQDWLREHGYDKPLSEQFKKHVTELALFRFGKSDATGEPIWGRIKSGVGPSFAVAAPAFFALLLTSVCFALAVAYFRGTYVDTSGTILCVLLMSVVYVVYVIAGQYLFGKILRWFPLGGFRGGMTALKFALLPTIVGVISGLGSNVRLYRTFLLDEMNQDYVRTARAKGVDERAVLFRHILKNASIPILTTTVLAIPFLLTGSIVLESFFGIPGLGSLLKDAIDSQDFAIVRAMVYLGTLLYIVGAILTDVSYALVDPRVRLE